MKKLNFSSLALFVAAFMGMSCISDIEAKIAGSMYKPLTTDVAVTLPDTASAQAQAKWAASAAERSNEQVTFAATDIYSIAPDGTRIYPHVVNPAQADPNNGQTEPNSNTTYVK